MKKINLDKADQIDRKSVIIIKEGNKAIGSIIQSEGGGWWWTFCYERDGCDMLLSEACKQALSWRGGVEFYLA